MIVVQTPLRVSFLGGGTDFDNFYIHHGGAVLSTAIDKFIFVVIKERFDDNIHVNYTKKEVVDQVDQLKHELVRESMRLTGVVKGIDISTFADIPAEGTGLGSSSSITVGLLQALFTYQGQTVSTKTLAEEACHIEIEIVGKPIGRQDQYIAAYGNMQLITFSKDGIEIEKVGLSPEEKQRLNDNLLLFYTGITRKSSEILSEQKANIGKNIELLHEIHKLVYKARDAILESEFDAFGEVLHKGWELKKQLASNISNSTIDEIYDVARRVGAIGGKVTGAGGGGFLLLYCPKDRQDDVTIALKGLRRLPFRFEQDGSKVIFNYRRS